MSLLPSFDTILNILSTRSGSLPRPSICIGDGADTLLYYVDELLVYDVETAAASMFMLIEVGCPGIASHALQ